MVHKVAARSANLHLNRYHYCLGLLLGLAGVGACRRESPRVLRIVSEPVPPNIVVADVAAAFMLEGKGVTRAVELPKEMSIFARPDAQELLLFRVGKDKLEPRTYSISKGQLIGDFSGGEHYLVHTPMSVLTKNKYFLLCAIKAIHERLFSTGRNIVDPLCTRILCSPELFRADTLLDEFPDLERFGDEFPRDQLKFEIGPAPKEMGDKFRLPGGGGNICEQCLERNWGVIIIPLPCRPGGGGGSTSPCWSPRGPGPNTLGQVENILNREVVGGINAVAPHPTDANVVFAGAVNGGIWRSNNGQAASPNWTRLFDTAESLSIGALEFDPTDATHQTLVAGTGRSSSFGDEGGGLTGVFRSTNGGSNWTSLDGGGTLRGLNISGVAPRGNIIVISVNTGAAGNLGVWRSLDTGIIWTRISGAAGSGLPQGRSFDLASDPGNPARLFTNAGGNGIFRSDDSGATWTAVGSAPLNALLANAANVEFSIGSSNNVYVAIVGGGQLSEIFRSGDGGGTWTAMGVPTTANGGIHPGGQGGLHLSIAADRSNVNVVYVGGDRQAPPFAGFPNPNAIGARDFSGILFRGDASQPAGNQFTPLTHAGTQSNSAPHADSRDMDLAANGVLIECDDGGIYRRTSPLNSAGDWFSMNGDVQTTEFHDIAWDANADIIIGGAQDTGTPQQQALSNTTWQSVSTADGGDVAVDDSSTPGMSTRYSSNQRLGQFRRQVFNAANVVQSTVLPARTVLNAGAAVQPQFCTPIKLNNANPNRLIIGAANSVYESLDQADTLSEIGPGIGVNEGDPIAYGAAGNEHILYVGSGASVFVRTAAAPAALIASATYMGGIVNDIAIDPANPNTAFVADGAHVFRTTDAGGAWTDLTGNLAALNPGTGTIRSLTFRGGTAAAVVIGTDTGVFIAFGPSFNSWSRFGPCLPRVPVYDLDYDPADRIFVAGTLGRGAWVLENQ